MRINIFDKLVFACVLAATAGTAYVRISSTMMGYRIGEIKHLESTLLEERSRLKMELAKVTNKSNLTILAERRSSTPEPLESLAAY